jgi:hypothetical protein
VEREATLDIHLEHMQRLVAESHAARFGAAPA